MPLVPLAPAILEGVVLGLAGLAALYVGICIGSFLVATGQTVATSTAMALMTFPLRLRPEPWMIEACGEACRVKQ